MANQRLFLLLSSLLLIGLTGCPGGGSKATPEVPPELKVKNPVKGQVIMEGGRSPERTEIKFYKEDETDKDSPVSRGSCDAFGYFFMSTGSLGDGVPPGKYKVTLFQTAKLPRGGSKPSPLDALDHKYDDLNNPVFTVDIPQGGKEDLQFKVTPLPQADIDARLKELETGGGNRDKNRNLQGKGND